MIDVRPRRVGAAEGAKSPREGVMQKPTFESIVREHGPFIRRTLAQLGVPSADLSDVEQEVLRGISRGLPTFDPELSESPSNALRGWLFAICERQAANHRRARLRRGELLLGNDELDSAPGDGPTSEERLIGAQQRAIVLRLVDELEPQRRAVIVAYELDGIPMAELAAMFAIPVNTAWNRLRLAREALREAWQRYERSAGASESRAGQDAPAGVHRRACLFGIEFARPRRGR
jgi:RNA polymerase sigma-70 factor (ECF subfamily)